jgi:hypothetical protein
VPRSLGRIVVAIVAGHFAVSVPGRRRRSSYGLGFWQIGVVVSVGLGYRVVAVFIVSGQKSERTRRIVGQRTSFRASNGPTLFWRFSPALANLYESS